MRRNLPGLCLVFSIVVSLILIFGFEFGSKERIKTRKRLNRSAFFKAFYSYFVVLPRIVPFNFEEPIYAGVTTQVSCTVAEGDTPIAITWSLHGSANLTDLGITTNKVTPKVSVLVIDSTELHHRGNYTCTARNRAGSTNYTAILNINGKLDANGQSFSLILA